MFKRLCRNDEIFKEQKKPTTHNKGQYICFLYKLNTSNIIVFILNLSAKKNSQENMYVC